MIANETDFKARRDEWTAALTVLNDAAAWMDNVFAHDNDRDAYAEFAMRRMGLASRWAGADTAPVERRAAFLMMAVDAAYSHVADLRRALAKLAEGDLISDMNDKVRLFSAATLCVEPCSEHIADPELVAEAKALSEWLDTFISIIDRRIRRLRASDTIRAIMRGVDPIVAGIGAAAQEATR